MGLFLQMVLGFVFLKTDGDTHAGGSSGVRVTARSREVEEFPYITTAHNNGNLPADNCIVFDPNRRDILYGLHETSLLMIPRKHD